MAQTVRGMFLTHAVGVAIATSIVGFASEALAQVYSYGSSGAAIYDIQNALGISADGYYGSQTETAVYDFQSRNGLQVDGQAGPETLRALGLMYLIEGNTSNVGGPSESYNIPSREGTAIVRTSAGDGVNVRNRPNGDPVAGVDDGTRVRLTGRQEFAGGYNWAEMVGGGWIATAYLVPDSVGGGGNGPVTPVPPIGSVQGGPYVVVVPGDDARDLSLARRYFSRAYVDRANQGSFINAGAYQSRSSAEDMADFLKQLGLDARVSYRRYR